MMKKARKRIIIVLATLITIGVCIYGGAYLYSKWAVSKIEIVEVDLSKVADGVHTGSAAVTPVKVRMSVNVRDGKIEDIKLLEHQTGLGKKGKAVLSDIVNKQSLDVDTVSGATQSSKTLIKAVENALLEK